MAKSPVESQNKHTPMSIANDCHRYHIQSIPRYDTTINENMAAASVRKMSFTLSILFDLIYSASSRQTASPTCDAQCRPLGRRKGACSTGISRKRVGTTGSRSVQECLQIILTFLTTSKRTDGNLFYIICQADHVLP